jgi:hypothetical protein
MAESQFESIKSSSTTHERGDLQYMNRAPSKLNVRRMTPILPPTATDDPAQVEGHPDAPSSPSVLLTPSQCVVASAHDEFGISESNGVHDIEVEADQGD